MNMKKQTVILNALESLSIQDKIDEDRILMKNFLFDKLDNPDINFVRLYIPPGIGKSRIMLEYITAHPNLKFIIITLNIDMVNGIDGIKEYLDANIGRDSWMQVMGKTQESNIIEWDDFDHDYIVHRSKLCNRRDGEEYFPGCKGCQFSTNRSCNYWKQWQDMYRKQVVVSTIDNISRLPTNRIIFFDESFDNAILDKQLIPEEYREMILLSGESTKKLGAHTYTFYEHASLSEDFEIINKETYFISMFFKYNTMIQARMTEKEELLVFGKKNIEFPDYQKMVFNCGTTPIDLMIEITDTKYYDGYNNGWYIHKCKHFKSNEIRNMVLSFRYNWTRKYSEASIPSIFGKFNRGLINKKILVITKKDFISLIKPFLPKAQYTHFGIRGINTYNQDYDLVIIYGRYGLTPIDYECFLRIGFKKKIVDQMGISAMLQAIHRFRPLLRPEIPVIIMSDQGVNFGNKPMNRKRWDDYIGNYDMEIDGDISLGSIAVELGYGRTKVKIARDFIKFKRFMTTVLERDVNNLH